jgi:hypothetical protein
MSHRGRQPPPESLTQTPPLKVQPPRDDYSPAHPHELPPSVGTAPLSTRSGCPAVSLQPAWRPSSGPPAGAPQFPSPPAIWISPIADWPREKRAEPNCYPPRLQAGVPGREQLRLGCAARRSSCRLSRRGDRTSPRSLSPRRSVRSQPAPTRARSAPSSRSAPSPHRRLAPRKACVAKLLPTRRLRAGVPGRSNCGSAAPPADPPASSAAVVPAPSSRSLSPRRSMRSQPAPTAQGLCRRHDLHLPPIADWPREKRA